jgi:hypothetical protein
MHKLQPTQGGCNYHASVCQGHLTYTDEQPFFTQREMFSLASLSEIEVQTLTY